MNDEDVETMTERWFDTLPDDMEALQREILKLPHEDACKLPAFIREPIGIFEAPKGVIILA